MAAIDYTDASELLHRSFNAVTSQFSSSAQATLNMHQEALDTIFESKTQSYREVLLGCALIRIMNPYVNIRLPYAKQGSDAFNGRTLDEQVINPFLMSKQIPCSKGPYLATFRRNVRLDMSTRSGLRDQHGYDAMMEILDVLENANKETANDILDCLLQKFIELRDRSTIHLVSVDRLSIEQWHHFLDTLLHNKSGGLIPMLVTEAAFDTINHQYNCGWSIDRQGINAADGATGAAGDITIRLGQDTIKAIEVTERPISGTRVTTTFNTKISIGDVKDYLFVYTATPPEDSAYSVSKTYFAQGYDINFIKLSNFVISIFIAGNASTRKFFMDKMLRLLQQEDIPATVKTAWNDALQATII